MTKKKKIVIKIKGEFIMANGDFAKRYAAKEGTTTPVKRDLSGARLRESERTEVKLEGGK